MEKLELTAIKPIWISLGGYRFSHAVRVPKGGKLFACLESANNRVDVTGGATAAKLPALLRCIDRAKGWGQSIRCWLALEQQGKIVGESAAKNLNCPVQPYVGDLTLDGFKNDQPKLTYAGNGTGRLLTDLIDGKYYFRNGITNNVRFETDNAMRGFDCTTFIMALLQCNISMAGKYGTYLVEQLGGEKCDMEQKKEKDIKAFFADKKKGATGLYVIWSAGHMMLVKDAVFHEFTYGGYASNPAANFPRYHKAQHGLWWVRKLPATYKP